VNQNHIKRNTVQQLVSSRTSRRVSTTYVPTCTCTCIKILFCDWLKCTNFLVHQKLTMYQPITENNYRFTYTYVVETRLHTIHYNTVNPDRGWFSIIQSLEFSSLIEEIFVLLHFALFTIDVLTSFIILYNIHTFASVKHN